VSGRHASWLCTKQLRGAGRASAARGKAVVVRAGEQEAERPTEGDEAAAPQPEVCLLQHATLTYMALQLGASAAYEETVATAACFYNEAFTIPAIKVRAGVRVRHTHTHTLRLTRSNPTRGGEVPAPQKTTLALRRLCGAKVRATKVVRSTKVVRGAWCVGVGARRSPAGMDSALAFTGFSIRTHRCVGCLCLAALLCERSG